MPALLLSSSEGCLTLGGRTEGSLLRPSKLSKTWRKGGEEGEEMQRERGRDGNILEVIGDVCFPPQTLSLSEKVNTFSLPG